MKLWVDDHRPAPRGWHAARSVAAAKVYLEQGIVTDMSLDHDLGACRACTTAGRHIGRMTGPRDTFYNFCPHVPSGYDLCLWMEHTGRWPRTIRVHSANPEGSARMLAVIARARPGRLAAADAGGQPQRASSGFTRAAQQVVAAVRRLVQRRRTRAPG